VAHKATHRNASYVQCENRRQRGGTSPAKPPKVLGVASDCILVVDDDDLVRDTLVELLKDHGCGARGAANGFVALEVLLTTDNVCLIILDLVMPLMDGNAFREEQLKRAELRDIPVVLMSAYGNLRNHQKAMQVDEYLQKPCQAAEVLDVVNRYCRCARARA
jgi:CheY-like chemotaxis protein